MDAKAGAALGKALAALRDNLNQRIDSLEAREPTYEVPVPSVTVEGAEIDLAPIAEALTTLAGLVVDENASRDAANQAMANAFDGMSQALIAQNRAILAIAAETNAALSHLTRATMAPKQLVFDDDGEPIGLVTSDGRTLN